MLIAEADMVVHKVTNRLHPGMAGGGLAEEFPGDIRQTVGVAIMAAQQIDQDVIGQFLDPALPGFGVDGLWLAGIGDHELGGDGDPAGGRHDSGAGIAEAVDIEARLHRGGEGDAVRADQVGQARGMGADHQQHGRGLGAVIGDLAAGTDPQGRGPDIWGRHATRGKLGRFRPRLEAPGGDNAAVGSVAAAAWGKSDRGASPGGIFQQAGGGEAAGHGGHGDARPRMH